MNIDTIIRNIDGCVQGDIGDGIDLRTERNSGKAICRRIGWNYDRVGDPQYARRLYTALRWLREHHDPQFVGRQQEGK